MQGASFSRTKAVVFNCISGGILAAAFLILWPYAQAELNTDKFHKDYDQIARLLLSATVLQVLVATLLSIPLAQYLIGKYLEKFSHKVPLLWWHYGLPLLVLLVIMGFTVASVLLKAAKRNPFEALRYE